MSIERQIAAIHATAVTLQGRALVIRGPSRSGKSSLALALIAASRADRPILLVGDDRLLLHRRGSAVLASPHPRIAGLIECRKRGILSTAYSCDVPVLGIVDLAPATTCDLAGQNFPALALVNRKEWSQRPARVLAWVATLSAQSGAKNARGSLRPFEDWNW